MSQLQAGAAKIPLAAVIGDPMGGYAVRREPAAGVHDQAHAKALCLDNGQTTLVMVTLDLIHLGDKDVARIRQRVREVTGIPEDHILISYSHTHSGPQISFMGLPERRKHIMREIWGDIWQDDPAWTDVLTRVTASAAIQAWRVRQPAKLGFGQGIVEGISFNRRRGDQGALDTEVMVLLATDLQDKPLAVMVNFACHPVILRHDNLLVTADYPWAMMALVETVYPDAVAMFAQGAAGDIDPLRHFWWGLDNAQRFDSAERIGRILGAEAIKIVNHILLEGCQSEAELAARSTIMSLPQEAQPTLEQAQALILKVQGEIDEWRAKLESHTFTPGDQKEEQRHVFIRHMVERSQAGLVWAELMKELAQEGKAVEPRQCEVQALRVGDARLLGMAGEIFNELGQEVKDALGRGQTLFLGYANGGCGYIPTPDSFTEGGHEVVFSQRMWGLSILAETGPLLVREAIALAQTI